MTNVSVVIGSFNQRDQLKKVIEGYVSQDVSISFEVVIVDSYSTDGTADMVAEFDTAALPFDLIFIQKDNPSGKAEARNVGVSKAKSEIVIITDADMIPDSNFVKAHYRAHKSSKMPCCFEGLAYNLDSYDWPPADLLQSTQVPKKYKNGDRLDWYYFLTGNISFPKTIFRLEKGFSHDFKSYGWEDLELGYRMKKRNIPLFYLTDAINFHYHVTTPQEVVDRKYLMGQSAQIFVKKHPELKLFLGLNPVSLYIRKKMTKQNVVYRFIETFRTSKFAYLQSFSYWFLGEFNYLSGLLNLSRD